MNNIILYGIIIVIISATSAIQGYFGKEKGKSLEQTILICVGESIILFFIGYILGIL